LHIGRSLPNFKSLANLASISTLAHFQIEVKRRSRIAGLTH